jgi:hypothetical protein
MLDKPAKAKNKPAAAATVAAPKADKKAAHKQAAPAAGKGGGYAAQRSALRPPAPPAAAAAKAKQPAATKPKEALKLPGSTTELLESSELQVAQVASYAGAKGMPGAIASLLMEGVRREAVSDAQTLQAVLSEYIDGGEVEVYRVAGGGKSLQWLRFWCGDTEVGYLFDGTQLVAIVGDQQINPL